ncbi:hypothetical protein Dtur_1570 [Dictyoglomus turgidum DSM 6724]|uniref:DNA-binding protein n=1 Tax=Dictyoglomus turgidum (strain DSM 6724 / Z-1310) TaxID=515635 RepID=B8E2K0_DICTD|nr:hypothetical protein Dtur_1570 [Dictyoglomus turgidum DSM 6724]HBU30903.1 hypothetical protein [Dictyoglomus sp.]
MIEKVINYLKDSNYIVDVKKLKKDLSLSDEEWDLILLQLRDLGYIKEINKLDPSSCKNCPYTKVCSQQCLQSEILYFELPHKDQDSE